MAKRDPFAHHQQSSAAYRRQRLEQERERLERRWEWAMERGDDRDERHLAERLDAIEEAIEADLSPGRTPGPIEPTWH